MAVGRLAEGMVLDGYRLGEQLAAGGMGAIWHATHPAVDVPLIIKVPFFAPGDDVATIVGFEVEEMVMRRLEGPHVPKFVGAGDLAAVPYLAMEFVTGDLLEHKMRLGPMPADTVAIIGAQIARALDSIHRQHVVHLDLKPANVILADRGAVLIDFGLALHEELPDLLGEESRLPMGSAPYMAPEQVLGQRLFSPEADIFALGAVLYEMITGLKPFGIPSSRAGMERRLYHAPKPPREIVPATPRWLQEVILRCLEIDPFRRYTTAAQLRFDLLHPEQVTLTERGDRKQDGGFVAGLKRVFGRGGGLPAGVRRHGDSRRDAGRGAGRDRAPLLLAAVDLAHGVDVLADEVRTHLGRVLAMEPEARLACLTVLKTSLAGLELEVDAAGRPAYLSRLVALKDWAAPFGMPGERVSFHVLEAMDVGGAILDYADRNDVDQIVMGARAASALRRHLGSVSAKVVAEARCSVMVVRVRQRLDVEEDEAAPDVLGDPTM
jgi:nucleotide-binding universal stress UspA family protein